MWRWFHIQKMWGFCRDSHRLPCPLCNCTSFLLKFALTMYYHIIALTFCNKLPGSQGWFTAYRAILFHLVPSSSSTKAASTFLSYSIQNWWIFTHSFLWLHLLPQFHTCLTGIRKNGRVRFAELIEEVRPSLPIQKIPANLCRDSPSSRSKNVIWAQ